MCGTLIRDNYLITNSISENDTTIIFETGVADFDLNFGSRIFGRSYLGPTHTIIIVTYQAF